jgi:hypothetical protein
MLEKISNPAAVAAGPDRERFEKLREKLLDASSQGNITAKAILSAAASASKTAGSGQENVKSVLQQIAAPTSATTQVNKERFEQLHKKLEDASKGGNELATSILAVKDTTSIEDIEKLRTKLAAAQQKGEPLATDVLANVTQPVGLPTANAMQQVSKEEFDEVKSLWKENYQNLEVPQGMAGTRADWIKDDISKIDNTVGLLTSQDPEKAKQGIEEVSNILPFLLMGGYSQSEIVAYLKAKQEAAKEVLQSISADEESKVSVGTTQHIEAVKTMSATTSAADDNESQDSVAPTASSVSAAASAIFTKAKLTQPKIKDIARYEAGLVTKDKARLDEANTLSSVLQKIADPAPITTDAEREEYKKLKETLVDESNKGNVTAKAILSAASSTSKDAAVDLNTLPLANAEHAVGPEEFDEVKSVWAENYQALPVPPEFGTDVKGRLEWIKRDMTEVQGIIDLLVSSDIEKKKEGIRKVTAILPFMLLGGFSLTEMIAYLKAKYDAAKDAVAKIDEEESKKVSVDADSKPNEEKAKEAS